jgi:predicted acyltransferase
MGSLTYLFAAFAVIWLLMLWLYRTKTFIKV